MNISATIISPLRRPDARTTATVTLALALLGVLGGCANTGPFGVGGSSQATLSRDSIAAILASPDRREADRANDVRRKPAELLAFIGVRPGMVALDLSAGGGYTTELLARAVGPAGTVYGQSAPRNPSAASAAAPEGNAAPMASAAAAATAGAPAPAAPAAPVRATSPVALAERARNPNASNIIPVVQAFENPVPPAVASNGLDLVTFMFNYHDLGHAGVDRALMNRAIFAALKPGGFYVVADHAGRPGTGLSESGTLHRVEEVFLRREIESVGFVLAGEGNFLRNPNDPRDKNTPVPPQAKDDFVLKFRKP